MFVSNLIFAPLKSVGIKVATKKPVFTSFDLPEPSTVLLITSMVTIATAVSKDRRDL